MSTDVNEKVVFTTQGEILLDGDPGKSGYMLVNNGGNTTPRWENIPFHEELQDSTLHFDSIFKNNSVKLTNGHVTILTINIPAGFDHFMAFGHSAFNCQENQTSIPLPWDPTWSPPYPPSGSSPGEFGGSQWGFKDEEQCDADGNCVTIQVPVTDLGEWIGLGGAEPDWWGSTASRGTGKSGRAFLDLDISPNGAPKQNTYQAVVFSNQGNSMKGMQIASSVFLDARGGNGAKVELKVHREDDGNIDALDYSLSVLAWKHPQPR
jgi:hypothetical protein